MSPKYKVGDVVNFKVHYSSTILCGKIIRVSIEISGNIYAIGPIGLGRGGDFIVSEADITKKYPTSHALKSVIEEFALLNSRAISVNINIKSLKNDLEKLNAQLDKCYVSVREYMAASDLKRVICGGHLIEYSNEFEYPSIEKVKEIK